MKRYKNLQLKGFTLIEILVVMTIVGILGSMLLVIFFNALRGSNKSNGVILIRQNGNYVVTQITNTVRYSRSVAAPLCTSGIPTSGKTLTVTNVDNTVVSYTCPPIPLSTIGYNDGNTTVPLLDTAAITVFSCSFTCQQSSSVAPPVIGINFTLIRNQGTLSENTASIPFSTTISLRNYGQ